MKVRCVVIYQQTPNNYCAYIPDFPGCISTGKTWEDIQVNIKEAIEGHIELMAEYGDPFPERYMTFEEAVAVHNEPMPPQWQAEYDALSDGDEADHPDLPDIFDWIELEVPSPVRAG